MTNSIQKKGRYSSYANMAELPHPRIPPEVFIIIHRVLVRALEVLHGDAQPLPTMLEDPITSALQRVIENKLRQSGEVPGFCEPLFERVTRQHECDSFDGSLQKERPDLFFGIHPDDSLRVRIQSDQWGVFAECKPVDTNHFAGSDYCDKGVSRFIRGDYAWAMQDALMVGYARDGRTIAEHLTEAMASRTELHLKEDIAVLQAADNEPGLDYEALHVSQHKRPFEWTNGRGPACSITLYHSWHNCGSRTVAVLSGTNSR